jgi:ribosome-binding factor A
MTRRSGKPASQRQLRIGEELRHVLAEILSRGELRDPDLQGRTITVTEVQLSPDLRNATAFVVPLGGGHEAEVLAALRRCSNYIRGVIGHQLGLRFAPYVGFEADRTFDNAQHILELLHRPEVQQDLGRQDLGQQHLAPHDEDADEGGGEDGA